ncbi:hypothetical protein [Tenacibaculum sp. nBUS_03]|uniref:hypothetical protein n=1 Tax=Tenacibaculum sp. nBUS_03 TaxID=3395320 RepID=UPI003EBD9A3B
MKNNLGKNEYVQSKITYSDTIYETTFVNKNEFKKMSDNKIISTEVDSTLMKRLIDCRKRMKIE